MGRPSKVYQRIDVKVILVRVPKITGTGQAWFPKNWTEKDIKRAGEHVASLKTNRHVKDGVKIYGMWKGVRVGIIHTNGQIGAIFPDLDQPKGKGGKRK